MSAKKALEDYRIGEFSKRMGVSSHFLKYYEESGILRPHVRGNGYRFYNLWHASTVLECVKLKNMGFSVRECHKLMTDSTLEDLEKLLENRQHALDRELENTERVLGTIQNLRAALRFCETREWRVYTVEPRWFLPHTSRQLFLEDAAIYRQLERWVSGMPLVCSTQRLHRSSEGVWSSEWGFSVDVESARRLDLNPEPPARLLPGVKVFEVCTSYPVVPGDALGSHLQEYERLFDYLHSLLKLVPGRTVLQQVLGYTLKEGRRQVYCILQVPVYMSPDSADGQDQAFENQEEKQ